MIDYSKPGPLSKKPGNLLLYTSYMPHVNVRETLRNSYFIILNVQISLLSIKIVVIFLI